MNRGFLYGDGFFESIRIVDGNMPLLTFHLERIYDALEIYQIYPNFDVSEEFIQGIAETYEPNGILRINFFRDGEGRYTPESNGLAFDHSFRLTEDEFNLPTGLDLASELDRMPILKGKIGLYPKSKPNEDWLTVKSLSSIYYVIASNFKKMNKLDYLFLANAQKELCEEVSSNIFLKKGEEITIPKLSAGGVNGVTQRYLMETYGFQIKEQSITYDDLDSFEHVFLSRGTVGVFRIK
ncbi:MAG: aminotransferase class IV [Bacteroidia bacterium]|nr:aminotransferase class IV [Bacteroidia bacterium]NNJ55629.1 aminotransferase class IV [Bacteroidia bacterium]